MRLFTVISLLVCFTSIYSVSLASESIVDQNDSITRSLKNRVLDAILNLQKKFYKAMKSPEGFEAPNICVWKICSKPLKKNRHGKNRPSTGGSKKTPRFDNKRLNDIIKAGVFLNHFSSI